MQEEAQDAPSNVSLRSLLLQGSLSTPLAPGSAGWHEKSRREGVIGALSREHVNTTEDLVKMTRSDLKRITKLAKEELEELLREASLPLYPSVPLTALQMTEDKLEQNQLRLKPGCPILDRFLRGGLLTRQLTEISGEAGSGKTQLCLQLCLQAQLCVRNGGLAGTAIYICTEGDFPSKRLQQICEGFGRKHPTYCEDLYENTGDFDVTLTDQVLIFRCETIEKLHNLITKNLPILMQQRNVRLLILDSIAALLRGEYGKEHAVERSHLLFAHAAHLKYLADRFNAVVVVINQVTDLFTDSYSSATLMGAANKKVIPSLGLAWSNCVNTRILLTKTRAKQRVLQHAPQQPQQPQQKGKGKAAAKPKPKPSPRKRKTAKGVKEEEAEEEEEKEVKKEEGGGEDEKAGGGPASKRRKVSSGGGGEVTELEVGVRQLQIVFAPHLPLGTCKFVIDGDGVRGVE